MFFFGVCVCNLSLYYKYLFTGPPLLLECGFFEVRCLEHGINISICLIKQWRNKKEKIKEVKIYIITIPSNFVIPISIPLIIVHSFSLRIQGLQKPAA